MIVMMMEKMMMMVIIIIDIMTIIAIIITMFTCFTWFFGRSKPTSVDITVLVLNSNCQVSVVFRFAIMMMGTRMKESVTGYR